MKADELRRDCDSDVYIVVRKEGRYYTYSSTSVPVGSWPPTEREIVSDAFSSSRTSYLTLIQSETYPMPQRFDPVKMEELRARQKAKAPGK